MEFIKLVQCFYCPAWALGGAPNTLGFLPLSLHAGHSQNTYLVELRTWAYLSLLIVFISFPPLDYKYRYTGPETSP
jgi:hypothetical protein